MKRFASLPFWIAALIYGQPLIIGPEHIYDSHDYPEAPSGQIPFYECFKSGSDAPISTLRMPDGRTQFYSGRPYRLWTSVSSTDTSDIFGMKSATSIRVWDLYEEGSLQPKDEGLIRNNLVYIYLMNIYKDGDGDLYGFLHIEDLRSGGIYGSGWTSDHILNIEPARTYASHNTGTKYYLGLAHCDISNPQYPCDEGGWSFLGTIVAPFNQYFKDGNKHSNIGGGAYMVKGGSIYVYFNDHLTAPGTTLNGQHDTITWISVARASIQDMADYADGNISGGPDTVWKKFKGYSGGCNSGTLETSVCWSEHPIYGRGGWLYQAGDSMGARDSHTDMVYSTVTGKYYMPLVEWGQVRLNSSDDGISWVGTQGHTWVGPPPVVIGDALIGPHYPSIVPVFSDHTSDDGSRVGGVFDVIYHNVFDSILDPEGRHLNRMYRSRVRLTSNPAAKPDYDGDGKADISVKTHSNTGIWHIDFSSDGFGAGSYAFDNAQSSSYVWTGYGDSTDIAAPADYDGDGLTDLAVKLADGTFVIDYAKDGFVGGISGWDFEYNDHAEDWDEPTCRPMPADYDGDGIADISVFCNNGYSNSRWDIDYSANGFNGVDYEHNASTPFNEDLHAVPGDYDGDGRADLAIKDDYSGGWFVAFADEYGIFGYQSWNNGFADVIYGWGGSNAKPAPADYDGDGVTDMAVMFVDGSNHYNSKWLIDTSSNDFDEPEMEVPQYLTSDHVPVSSDYDGDGKADLAARVYGYDASWYIDYAANGFGSWDIEYTGWDDGNNSQALGKKPVASSVEIKTDGGGIALSFVLPDGAPVKVEAYGVDGKRIATLFQGRREKGSHRLSWTRDDLGRLGLKRGVYLISLISKNLRGTRKIVFSN